MCIREEHLFINEKNLSNVTKELKGVTQPLNTTINDTYRQNWNDKVIYTGHWSGLAKKLIGIERVIEWNIISM